MIDDIIRPYPGEDEVSYIKRKAYYHRILIPRTKVGCYVLVNQDVNCLPLRAEETRAIDAFWDRYLSPSIREKLIDYRYYSVYKTVLKEDENLLDYIPDSFYQTFIDDYYSNPRNPGPVMTRICMICIFMTSTDPKPFLGRLRGNTLTRIMK